MLWVWWGVIVCAGLVPLVAVAAYRGEIAESYRRWRQPTWSPKHQAFRWRPVGRPVDWPEVRLMCGGVALVAVVFAAVWLAGRVA